MTKINMTQPQIEDEIEDIKKRLARLELASLISEPLPIHKGPSKFKHIDVIPVVEQGEDK